MRHHAHHVASLAANPGDIIQRAVGICTFRGLPESVDISEYDLPILFDLRNGFRIGKIGAFTMSDRHPQYFSLSDFRGKWRVAIFRFKKDWPTDEMERFISN